MMLLKTIKGNSVLNVYKKKSLITSRQYLLISFMNKLLRNFKNTSLMKFLNQTNKISPISYNNCYSEIFGNNCPNQLLQYLTLLKIKIKNI
ncbi:unnamed protein product [Paramecium pentaurelia]|uniref:Uncharacterized protein n=1 Tax=Paramecium pentaurelia TaxID=43138 RepID=A0A8S1YJM4_9CILI|nr:unnamed protein product [Paramecium pentaurelia]